MRLREFGLLSCLMVIRMSGYNLGSNRASNFKLADHMVRGWFQITSTITPELYDTKSYVFSILLIN